MMTDMISPLTTLWTLALAGGEGGGHAVAGAARQAVEQSTLVWLIPGLPLFAAILAMFCAIGKVKTKLPAALMVLCLAGAFGVTFWLFQQISHAGPGAYAVVHLFDWINFDWAPGKAFVANFSLYIDSLTCLWMLFVTGLATCIALYASEYMSHDVGPGYCRFFFAFGLFVFSMACLVMGDNLLLLYLGWEGVGLCSYLLIGYFYQKPSAVAAAKKAFILNRIGDLGLALAIMLAFVQFGTIEYAKLWPMIQGYVDLAAAGKISEIPQSVQLIAVLLTLAAFGKSAQLPLYVWLPDAMEGPTPVSALIHAATMVTAGIYLIARMMPFYQVSIEPFSSLEGTFILGIISKISALEIVAYVGGLTALLAATIGMAQFDIKRIMAYSTVSQLGFMFAGLGVLTTYGAAFHVFTHAFFKATLFLSCGAVMHGFAGQLDLRKLSGVMWMKGWLIVGLAMLVGCMNLAGVPFTAGFFSKDVILAEAFSNPHFRPLAWILLFTALLTAYYTFRVFFRVFVGPKAYEPGDELHSHDHAHDHGHGGHGDHDHGDKHAAKAHDAKHDFHPHAPGWAINTVLAVLALASIAAAYAYPTHFVQGLVNGSSAAVTAIGHHEHATIFGYDPHAAMYYISGVVGAVGIIAAFWLHYVGRKTAAVSKADGIKLGAIQRAAQNKWYVDEIYDYTIRLPLKVLSHMFHLLDKLVVDGLVNLVGMLPRVGGLGLRPSQSGVLHGYAVGMAAGIAVIAVIALLALT